jgi:intracellular sulfur oxidation DsrE/DsrF family protein
MKTALSIASLRMVVFLLLGLAGSASAKAQQGNLSGPAAAYEQRLARFSLMADKLVYPAGKGGPMTGVFPIDQVSEPIDPNLSYKLIFDLGIGTTDQKLLGLPNRGLEEVARIINLHRASGIDRNKLDVLVVIYSHASSAVLNNEQYRKMYNQDNPNLALISQFQDQGIRFVVCGQTMQLRNLNDNALAPGVRKAFSARTTFSTYQSKGYILFEIPDMY